MIFSGREIHGVKDSKPDFNVAENEYFKVKTSVDGAILEIEQSPAGKEMLKELQEQMDDSKEMAARAEKAVELTQGRVEMLTKILKERFSIDEPSVYTENLNNSWVAIIKHGAKTAIDPEFRAVFEDYLNESESLSIAQMELDAANTNQSRNSVEALRENILFTVKKQAAKNAREISRRR